MSDNLLEDARVLIIDPAFLGDAVFNGPVVRALKRRGAQAVGLVVRPPADAIARAMPDLDETHVFDKYGRNRGLRGLRRVAGELERAAYDVALIPHPSVRSALLARLARIPKRVGAGSGPRTALFTACHRAIRADETYVDFRFRIAGLEASGPDERALAGVVSGGARGADRRIRVGLALGSNYATKRWPPGNAKAFVQMLEADRHTLVLLGTDAERPLYGEVSEGASGSAVTLEDHLGEDVSALVDTLGSLDLLVAGDTGPLHIARALGVPVVAAFGPTSPARHLFGAADRVLVTGIECQPCGPHGHVRCPLGHHRCMTQLVGETVADAVSEVAADLPPE